uniref:uncharacterized protein LOC118143812 isoform X2 n=1 Tax=Callithrix jacchus TaxID=9483 RepID=UPI00159E03FA|nr:uncharacterized protein LOC118143812 isoform X2 [Callithrix jacchus]
MRPPAARLGAGGFQDTHKSQGLLASKARAERTRNRRNYDPYQKNSIKGDEAQRSRRTSSGEPGTGFKEAVWGVFRLTMRSPLCLASAAELDAVMCGPMPGAAAAILWP